LHPVPLEDVGVGEVERLVQDEAIVPPLPPPVPRGYGEVALCGGVVVYLEEEVPDRVSFEQERIGDELRSGAALSIE